MFFGAILLLWHIYNLAMKSFHGLNHKRMNFEEAFAELDSLLSISLSDENIQELRTQLGEVQTMSELVAFTKEHFKTMYDDLHGMLTDFVLDYLPQDICSVHGILINPERMPCPIGDAIDYIAVSDGSVKTIQDTPETVVYYGNVDLTISQGAAVVMKTCHPVSAEGNVFLSAGGETVVNSTGPVHLALSDRARATVEEAAMVELTDRTFLESKSGNPEIVATDEAQFVVSGGSADITMAGTARGVILNRANPDEHYQVDQKGYSLLFVENSELNNFEVDQSGQSVLIKGSVNDLHAAMLRDAIVPWRNQKAEYIEHADFIEDPDMIRLRMQPFLPELDEQQRAAWMQADTGWELCQLMKDWIPEMVQKGLTGRILRNNFRLETMICAQIYHEQRIVFSFADNHEPRYYFGSQMVHTTGGDCPVYGFENTLVLTEQKAEIAQSASAIGSGESVILARGNAHAIGQDSSQLVACEQATVWGNHETSIDACDHTTVYAADNAQVTGRDHAWIELYGNSKATVEGDCRVVSAGDCTIETFDKAKVWQATYVNGSSRPTVTAHNGEAKVGVLECWESFNALRMDWEREKDQSLQKSAGLHR